MDALKIEYTKFPVLVVDDEVNNLQLFRLQFRRKFDIHTASSAAEALAMIEPGGWQPAVIVTDQRMPKVTGIELLRKVEESQVKVVGVLLTAFSDWDVLLEALHSGLAYRYLTKPWNPSEVEIAIRQAIERYALEQENRRLVGRLSRMNEYLEDELKGGLEPPKIIGLDSGLSEVMRSVRQIASAPSTVLLRGESGTGKEVIARAIHDFSDRATGPFIKISCSALSAHLLESELFGHEKGAFTDAYKQRIGRFELAHMGTIFLDEIGDISLDTQVRLLRVLQEREFERVGGTKTIQVDVRVIAATHRDLEALIREGKFREDLYYRLNVVPIYLPRLRDRPQDIPALVQHFVRRSSATSGRRIRDVSAEAMDRLVRHDWPGNVRELQNVIERAVLLSWDAVLESGDLILRQEEGSPKAAPLPSPAESASFEHSDPLDELHLDEALAAYEKRRLKSALERAGGSKAAAARALGLSRTTLYYRLSKHGLIDEEPSSS